MKLALIEARDIAAQARPEFVKAAKEFLVEHPDSTGGHY
jgi:hypothetical protein